MQQKLLLALFVMNTALTASAQTRFAIKAGFTTSSIKVPEGSSAASYTSKSGVQFGLAGNVSVSKNFDLLTGLLYTQKGYTEEYGKPGDLGHALFDRRINYLELPVDLVCNIKTNARFRFFAGTGLVPAVGISDKARYSLDFSGRPQDAGTTQAGFGNGKYYKLFGLGWNVLGGVEINDLVLSVDYNTGLTSVNNDGYGIQLLKEQNAIRYLGLFSHEEGLFDKQ